MFHTRLVLAVFLATPLACGSNDASNDASNDGADIPIEELATEYLAAVCQKLTACDYYPVQAACIESHRSIVTRILADAKAGLVDYDPKKARECINSLAPSGCIRLYSDDNYPACQEMFSGAVPHGGACFYNWVCAGHSACSESNPDTEICQAGVCAAALEHGTLGEHCIDRNCTSNLLCGQDDTCLERPVVGQECLRVFDCLGAARCKINYSEGTGICVALAETGQDCEIVLGSDGYGRQQTCAKTTDFCNSQGICQPKISVGESCSYEWSNCIDYSECLEGICVATPKLGESCDYEAERECLGSLDCYATTCLALPDEPSCSL